MSSCGVVRLEDGVLIYPNMLVVAFDICSSAAMLDDLIMHGHEAAFDELLKRVHKWLDQKREEFGYRVYKFTGDGWILLFRDPKAYLEKDGLLKFLIALCEEYRRLRRTKVYPLLQTHITDKGLTFGIADGPNVRRLKLGDDTEYVGRPLVLASRLQATVKDEEGSRDYIALATQDAFVNYLKGAHGIEYKRVRRRLRNVMGGARYRLRRIDLNLNMSETNRAAGNRNTVRRLKDLRMRIRKRKLAAATTVAR